MLFRSWELPDLRPDTKSRIMSIIGEKTPIAIQNPIDLTGPGFLPKTYVPVLETVLQEDFDAYLVVWNFNPFIRVPLVEFETMVNRYAHKTIVMVNLASRMEVTSLSESLAARGICCYPTPEAGATALNALLSRHHFLKREELR